MLFNSYIFILLFLPLTLLVFHLCTRLGYFRLSILALVAASFVFYAWWSVPNLVLFLVLIFFNFGTGKLLLYSKQRTPHLSKPLLILGLTTNLGVLCYFKYTNFLIDNANSLLGTDIYFRELVLPLGISFFTFQKIAFLIDVYQGKTTHFNLLDFLLFVMFFPQLIAGPIVHHREIMPQFARRNRITTDGVQLGLTIFVIGLGKKMLLADTAASFASPYFQAAAGSTHLNLISAWCAALCYTAQLYFDFSAYTDMAIGIGQLFGIRLPLNFDSPYKAVNIVDFWRRWHMTLSRFLRDYLYVPLGGNRRGNIRRYVNLFITMVLGGIWHGAGWTFVIWGGLHGVYLIVNHGWQSLCTRLKVRSPLPPAATRLLGQTITFMAVVVGWVFFRAADAQTAIDVLKSMAGVHGAALPASLSWLLPDAPIAQSSVDSGYGLAVAVILLAITWGAPNTQQLVGYRGPSPDGSTTQAASAGSTWWSPSPGWAVAVGCVAGICFMMFSKISEFIYFQF